MNEESRLLVVGGTGRNVGKTELVCRIIAATATRQEVYALKVSAIFPDEELFHGHHEEGDQELFEEQRRETDKDTSRMLRAGARRVFYLRCDDQQVLTGFARFLAQIPPGAAVVCESNSLAQFIRPSLYLMVRPPAGPIKARALPQLEKADLVIVSDGRSGFPEIERVAFIDGRWQLTSV